jgi:hypothetical protein
MTAIKTLAAVTVMLASAAVAGTADASMYDTGSYGAWTTAEGTDADGQQMCLTKIVGKDRAFMLKAIAGSDNFLLQIFKLGWRIPDGKIIKVLMQVDQSPPFVLYGSGRDDIKDFGGIDFPNQWRRRLGRFRQTGDQRNHHAPNDRQRSSVLLPGRE